MKVYALSALAWTMIAVCLACTMPLRSSAQTTEPPAPQRFESAILAFEKQDKVQRPPTGAIVCTGSSSMRMWHNDIAKDLAPLTVIPRGFGGSMMDDLLYYADRVILKYNPRAVVIYEGDNDTNFGLSPRHVRDTFLTLAKKIHAHDDSIRIYFLAIKPSPRRKDVWPTAVKANELIKAECDRDDRLTYIDIASPMMRDDGSVDPSLFIKDMLHMNRKGYGIWKSVVRPVLMKHEADRETPVRSQ